MKHLSILILSLSLLLGVSSCKSDNPTESTPKPTAQKPRVKVPKFDGDKAYALVEKQLSFGHRIPGTPEHKATKDWYVEQLKAAGADVQEQEFKASFLGLEDKESYNIIASFNPKNTHRIMLAAHWDSRLIAEKDKDKSMQEKPIMGADDGATGTAILLEIANMVKENPIDLGIDIVLFDAEDQGDSNGAQTTWCLGSQYWGKNPHVPNYKATFGILLDMVGAKDAQFGLEGFSFANAGEIQKKIWGLARGMGYSDYFQNFKGGQITDDHYYVMTHRQFPMVDIINMPKDPTTGETSFGHYHHTHKDNIDIVSKRTLKVVGQVVTAVIYKESDGSF